MNFIKTQELLTQQIKQKDIPLESVLELMRTYLTELYHHTNSTIEECRIEDMPRAVAGLAAVSNDVLFVYETNEKAIEAEESRIARSLTETQNICRTHHSRIAQLDEQIKAEEAALKEKKALLEKEQLRNADLAKLQKEIAEIQAKIKDLSVKDPETEAGKLKNELADLNKELERVDKEYNRLQQEYTGKKQEFEENNRHLTKLQTDYENAKAEWEKAEQTGRNLEKQRKDIQEKTARLKEDITVAKKELENEIKENDCLIEEQVATKAAVEAQKLDNQNFRANHLEPTRNQLEKLRNQAKRDLEELDKLKDSIKALGVQRSTIAQETTLVKVELKSKEAALKIAQAEFAKNKQAVDDLEKKLQVTNTACAPLLAREKELQERLDEKNVAKIIKDLEDCIRQLEKKIKDAEEKEKELEDTRQKKNDLERKLSETERELEKCREQEKSLYDSYKLTEEELNRITCAENRARCEKLYNQWLTMQVIRNKLINGVIKPCGEGFSISEELQKELSLVEKTLQNLRSVIREYTLLRQNNLNDSH